MNASPVLFFVALAGFGAASFAQHPAAVAAVPDATAPIRDQGRGPDGAAVGPWAAGRDFKCSFAGGTFTFVPYLGQTAPRSLPWRWRTTAATVGEHDLRLGEPARGHHGEQRFAATSGLVTERWDVTAVAVEQSFVVATRPGAGELVVRGTVDGPWHAAPRNACVGPLVFRADGGTELHYGAALAIDAAGRRWPVPTAFDGAAISLHVAAEIVAAAQFPLVIDPLLNVFVVDSGVVPAGHGILGSALDHVEATDAMSLVRAEVRWASIADGDVLVWRTRADFAVSQLLHSDLDPNAQAFDASVAGVGTDRSVVVAWSRGATASSAGIVWIAMPIGSTAAPVVHTLWRPSGTVERQPRVGGRRGFVAGANGRALLVRLRETAAGTDNTEVWGSVLHTTTGLASPPFQIANGGVWVSVDNAEPWVARDATGTDDWLVAHQSCSSLDDQWNVVVRRVAYDGWLQSGYFEPTLPQGGPWHYLQPRLEGSNGRMLLAFVVAPVSSHPGKLTTFQGNGVYVQRFDWTATAFTLGPQQYLAASFERDLVLGGLAGDWTTESHWALAWAHDGDAPTLAQLGYRGRVIRSTVLPGPGATVGNIVFRPVALAFDGTLERWQVHYGVRGTVSGGIGFWSYGGRYEYPALAAPQSYGPSCGAGSIGSTERFRIGSDRCAVLLTGAPHDVPAIGAFSLQAGSVALQPFGLGGCTLLVEPLAPHWLGSVVAMTGGSGNLRMPIVLPENLAPCDLHAQWLTLQANGELAATSALRVEIR